MTEEDRLILQDESFKKFKARFWAIPRLARAKILKGMGYTEFLRPVLIEDPVTNEVKEEMKPHELTEGIERETLVEIWKQGKTEQLITLMEIIEVTLTKEEKNEPTLRVKGDLPEPMDPEELKALKYVPGGKPPWAQER